MSKLSYDGLKTFKEKNDDTYLGKDEVIDVTSLDEETEVDDDDIIIKGKPETGDLVRIKASDFFAKINSALTDKSNALSVSSASIDNLAVTADSYASATINCSRSGYTPLGIVGYRVSNASSSGVNSSRCYVYRLDLSGTTITCYIANRNTSIDANVMVVAQVLYVADDGTTISPQGYPDDENPDNPTVNDPEGTPVPED